MIFSLVFKIHFTIPTSITNWSGLKWHRGKHNINPSGTGVWSKEYTGDEVSQMYRPTVERHFMGNRDQNKEFPNCCFPSFDSLTICLSLYYVVNERVSKHSPQFPLVFFPFFSALAYQIKTILSDAERGVSFLQVYQITLRLGVNVRALKCTSMSELWYTLIYG